MPDDIPSPTAEPAPGLRCDTCGRETATVSRVVVDSGYNRANARPLYNCPQCFEQKDRERRQQAAPGPPAGG